MSLIKPEDFANLYAAFQAPIFAFDCGRKCAPHNARGVPFCCDTRHAVPTAYDAEWHYLRRNTDLWHLWDSQDKVLKARLQDETPDGMRLIECLGHQHCQRGFRALTCRQFPFFPYLTSSAEFIGLSYYWEYEDRCWVISNLHVVTSQYRQQFIQTFDRLFAAMPQEVESYRYHSELMRDEFNQVRRAIPLLHRNGFAYKISTHNERMRRVPVDKLPKFGPYKLAEQMAFPDEIA